MEQAKRCKMYYDSDDDTVAPLLCYDMFAPADLPVRLKRKLAWNVRGVPQTSYAKTYAKYKGQGYFDVSRKGPFKGLKEMAVLKNLPVFESRYHDMLQHYESSPHSLDTFYETVEGLFCLVERPVNATQVLQDAFWEDLQTFAHLSALIDLHFTLMCKYPHLDTRLPPQPTPLRESHLSIPLEACVKSVKRYTLAIKPHIDMHRILHACEFSKPGSVAHALLCLEVAKTCLLNVLLLKYEKPGPPVVKMLRERLTLIVHNLLGDNRTTLREKGLVLGVHDYLQNVDHRRSFRTLHVCNLPIADMATDTYAFLLTRQLAVGVVPLYDFENDYMFLRVDASFHDVPLPSNPVSVLAALWQLPDPVVDASTFHHGLQYNPKTFSQHTCYSRMPRAHTPCERFHTPPATTNLKIVYYLCNENCSPENPACPRCVQSFFSEPYVRGRDNTLIGRAFHALTFDLAPFPPCVQEDINNTATEMIDHHSIITLVARMVRIYSEIRDLGLPLRRREHDYEGCFPRRYDLFEPV